jgi:hypothetical protein
MRAPLATRSNTEGGGSSVSKDLLAKVKAAAADKEVSEMKEVAPLRASSSTDHG